MDPTVVVAVKTAARVVSESNVCPRGEQNTCGSSHRSVALGMEADESLIQLGMVETRSDLLYFRTVKSHCTAVSLTLNGQISQSHCYTRKSHCK